MIMSACLRVVSTVTVNDDGKVIRMTSNLCGIK